MLGLRNSHDKTFPAGIVAGSAVFICDNLAFSGEVKLARKHTTHITRDLPRLVQSAVGQLMDRSASSGHPPLDLQAHRNLVQCGREVGEKGIRAVRGFFF